MARTDDDTWDLASSVGVTATLVAAARALASRQDDPLIDDPFAAELVRAVGVGALTGALEDGSDLVNQEATRTMIDVIAVRTRFFDDFFIEAGRESAIRQAVILASGLDARAYRLPWPAGMTIYEIDQPDVIDFKSRVLADLGVAPTAERRSVGVDLRDDWPAALRAHGFDTAAPTAWIAEGLLIYLPPDAQDRLFDNITTLSAPGSRIATEYHPDGGSGIAERASSMRAQWAGQGLDLNLGDLFYGGEREPVVDCLTRLGWQVGTRTRPEMFAEFGRNYPDDPASAPLRTSLSVTAIRK
jgi:methyltransferase (TIGR00027 family)